MACRMLSCKQLAVLLLHALDVCKQANHYLCTCQCCNTCTPQPSKALLLMLLYAVTCCCCQVLALAGARPVCYR